MLPLLFLEPSSSLSLPETALVVAGLCLGLLLIALLLGLGRR
jgi:hypothetical protein